MTKPLCSVAILAIAAVACGGGASEFATSPSPVGLAASVLDGGRSMTSAPYTDPPLTIADIAPVLGEMLTIVTEEGLRQGSTQAGPGRWTYACPGGGTAQLELPDTLPADGTVAATETAVVWTDCTMTASAATNSRPLSARTTPIVGRGRLALRLRTWQFWHPVRGPIYTNPNPPIDVEGSLSVNDIGPVPVNCSTSAASCNGTIGGVTTGAPDTAPPPNPTPAPCMINGIPVQCPAPAPVPAPAPAPTALNVTGTWVVAGEPGSMALSQPSGSTSITGSVNTPTPPLPAGTTMTVTANSVSGTIAGSAVALTHTHGAVVRTAAGGIIITATGTGTTRYSLQATSSTMTGTAATTTTTTTSCSGSEFCPPSTTTTSNSSQSVTLTRQ